MKVQDNDERSLTSTGDQLTIDQALTKVGAKHRYQKIVFGYFCLQWLITDWILTAPVYLFKEPTIRQEFIDQLPLCKSQQSYSNDSDCQKLICSYVKNNLKQPEDQWKIMLVGESALLEFDPPLICEYKVYRKFVEQQVYVGSLLGFFLFSYIADNFGRKPCLGISWFIATVGVLIVGSSVNYYMIGIGLFCTGFGANPAITIHYSYINEHSQGKFREYQCLGVQIFFGIAELFLPIISYYFKNWRILILFWFSIPMILINLPIFFIQESPKFMYQKNVDKSLIILNKIAQINNRPKLDRRQLRDHVQAHPTKNYWAIHLVKYASIRKSYICGTLIFVCIQYIFYSISFTFDQLDLNFYVLSFIVGIFNTLAYSICDFVIPFLRRRYAIMMGFTLTAIVCFVYQLFTPPDDCGDFCAIKIFQMLVLGMSKFLISSVWGFAYVYLSELFPTVVRSLAMGIISAGGMIGSISSPFNEFFTKAIGLPNNLIILGFVALIGAASAIVPRETYHVDLEDEIEEEKEETMQYK